MYCGTLQSVSCPNYTEKQQRDANTDILHTNIKAQQKEKKKKEKTFVPSGHEHRPLAGEHLHKWSTNSEVVCVMLC